MIARVFIGASLLILPATIYAYIQSRDRENEAINFERKPDEPAFYFPEDEINVNPENVKSTSPRGRQLIKNAEGFSSVPYKDPAGYLTIGFGHLIKNDETFAEISREEAETILAFDLNDAENCIIDNVTPSLSQNQFDALVSFIFNVGCGNFKKSTLLKKLNAGDFEGAANEFNRWIYSNGKTYAGLVTRREDEKQLFLA